jgi:Calx-beta domain-containing protein
MRLAHVLAAGALVVSLAAGGGLAAGASGALSIGDAQAREGNSGSRALSFRVTLSESSKEPVSVSYRTQNETALVGEDYVGTQGSLEFAPGERTKNVEVSIRGDRKVEPDEFFSVILFAPNGATVAEPGGVGTGAIQNDDVPALLCNCKRVKLRLAGFHNGPDPTRLTAVVKVTMTCRAGDVADCAGFVRAVSSFATLKPTPFTCRAKKCSSTNTYTLRVRIAKRPLTKKLRLRAGCRGVRGELQTFTLALPQ